MDCTTCPVWFQEKLVLQTKQDSRTKLESPSRTILEYCRAHQKQLILPCHQRETRELTTPRPNWILHQNLKCRLPHAAVLPALRWQRGSIQRILTFPILMMHDADSPQK